MSAPSRTELLVTVIARLLQGCHHVAVGASSPIPGSGALLARALSEGEMRVSVLGSRRNNFFTNGGVELFDLAAEGRIDAFFYTVGNPAAAIEEPANSVDIDMVSINSQAIADFIADKPYYVMTTLPAGTYKGVDEPIETFAVKATVVASARSVSAAVARAARMARPGSNGSR